MKILMISSYLPYPLFSGGQVRLYNLIKELSGKHEITLICEKRHHQSANDIAEVKKICKDVNTVERKNQWSVQNILKTGISSHSFLVTGHTQSAFKQKIQEALDADTFDLIHVETYYVMQNLPITKLPIVLVEHNIEYQVYEKFRDRSPLFARPFLQRDIAKIKKEEEYFWKKATCLVAVSREDQEIMKNVVANPYVVSNGVNIDEFIFKEKKLDELKVKKLLFIGDFKWIQNQDAVEFILKEVWPQIKEALLSRHSGERSESRMTKENLDVKLWIVGRKIPTSIRSLTNDPDVIFDEESSAKSTPEIFQEAAILLAPIRVGGGTSYKILEAMSSGTPVVTMGLSAGAIDAKDTVDLMVGRTPDEVAEKTLKFLEDDQLYKTISKNGRMLIENNYTWKEIGKKLEEVYTKAVLY